MSFCLVGSEMCIRDRSWGRKRRMLCTLLMLSVLSSSSADNVETGCLTCQKACCAVCQSCLHPLLTVQRQDASPAIKPAVLCVSPVFILCCQCGDRMFNLSKSLLCCPSVVPSSSADSAETRCFICQKACCAVRQSCLHSLLTMWRLDV